MNVQTTTDAVKYAVRETPGWIILLLVREELLCISRPEFILTAWDAHKSFISTHTQSKTNPYMG